MKKILLLIFGLFTMLSYSQDNSDAELLLNKVSENIKNYENIYINYAYTLQNIEEDINQTNNGSFVTEDEKWRFEMLGVTRIFDGNKLYSISPDDEEVTFLVKTQKMKPQLPQIKCYIFMRKDTILKWMNLDLLEMVNSEKKFNM